MVWHSVPFLGQDHDRPNSPSQPWSDEALEELLQALPENHPSDEYAFVWSLLFFGAVLPSRGHQSPMLLSVIAAGHGEPSDVSLSECGMMLFFLKGTSSQAPGSPGH